MRKESAFKIEREETTPVVGAVIFKGRRNAVLVAQRSKYASHPLKYEFIGGKIESWESVEEAAVREVKEEIDLDIEAKKVLFSTFYDYSDSGKSTHQLIFVECFLKDKNQIPRAKANIHQEVRWVRLDEMDQLDWIEADKLFINMLKYDFERVRRELSRR